MAVIYEGSVGLKCDLEPGDMLMAWRDGDRIVFGMDDEKGDGLTVGVSLHDAKEFARFIKKLIREGNPSEDTD
jgi:hypothetical protein